MENKQKTQQQQANEALMALAINVSTSDRKEALNSYSEFTIIQYLKGRGKDLDTAMALLEFFRKRIADRNKVIA